MIYGSALFDREARALCSLNLPNVCTLHDVGYQNCFDYRVLDYREGETLARQNANFRCGNGNQLNDAERGERSC